MNSHVVPETKRHKERSFRKLSKCETKALVASGLQREVLERGIEAVADDMDCTTRCVRKALSHETLPEADKLGNLLAKNPSALFEWFAQLGLHVGFSKTIMSPDMLTASQMSRAVATFIEILEDGTRNHRETCELAAILRPLIPRLSAIVHEADGLRSVA